MIGESIVDSSAVYPGEVRGRYEKPAGLSDYRQNRFRLVNVGDRVHAGQTDDD